MAGSPNLAKSCSLAILAAVVIALAEWRWYHDFHDREPAIGRFAAISRLIVKSICLIFLKLRESDFLLYATRFSIMRSLVKRLGMGLPNNLLPEFPAITGSLIDRSIDLLLTFLKICLAAHAIAH